MRRIVSAFAVMSVLLHALALVHHNAAVIAIGYTTDAATLALQADLGTICHSGSDLEGKAVRPADEKPPSGTPKCPICSGLCSAVALAVPIAQSIGRPSLPSQKLDPPVDQRAELNKRIRPPGRGPPAHA